jgi:pyrroline-5-carboxylate reductase
MGGQLTIGIIGGNGWLGRAFAGALVQSGIVEADRLTLSYRSGTPQILPQAKWTTDNRELVDRSDIVILSVRPEDLPAVTVTAEGKLIVSVMAGITLAELSRRFKTERVVRTLPNAGAEVGTSYTPWVASAAVTQDEKNTLRRILEACGTADEMSREADIDYFTGMTGSGPAFPALLAAAMMKDAISRGIDPGVARRAANALLVGTGRLVELRNEDPLDLVQVFLDYRGTTAAAIEAMRARGFDAAVSAGLEAAFQKSVTMGQAS